MHCIMLISTFLCAGQALAAEGLLPQHRFVREMAAESVAARGNGKTLQEDLNLSTLNARREDKSWLPKVDVGATGTLKRSQAVTDQTTEFDAPVPDAETTTRTRTTSGDAGVTLHGEWTLYDGGARRLARENAHLGLEDSKRNLAEEERALTAAMLFDLTQLVLANQDLALARQNLRDFSSIHDIVTAKVKSGLRPENDAQESLVELERERTRVAVLEADFRNRIADFNRRYHLATHPLKEEQVASLDYAPYVDQGREFLQSAQLQDEALRSSPQLAHLSLERERLTIERESQALKEFSREVKLFSDLSLTGERTLLGGDAEATGTRSVSRGWTFGIAASARFDILDHTNFYRTEEYATRLKAALRREDAVRTRRETYLASLRDAVSVVRLKLTGEERTMEIQQRLLGEKQRMLNAGLIEIAELLQSQRQLTELRRSLQQLAGEESSHYLRAALVRNFGVEQGQ